MKPTTKLRILIPKGRIFENIGALFAEAGLPLKLADRTYRPVIGEGEGGGQFEAKIMKPQNVGTLLEIGAHDCGFTGIDWITESGADVVEVLDLGLDKVQIVAACPLSLDDRALTAKKITAATEYVNLADRWLSTKGYDYRVLRTYGATEVFPPDDADIIIDNTATGQTLKDNGLRVIDTLLESSTRFVASREAMADAARRKQIETLAMLFRAVLEGRDKVMLEMNVSTEAFAALVEGLPAMRSPTISPLYKDSGYAVKIAVKKSEAPALIPRLKALGATDIVEYELRKVIP
ncbi:MAG: ATP phosphoribosyltransferase [Spirochaetaceae bacterium]|jgi:ATP phosphoribosyltransferase|nr:ATP phosphoribosyltransferase [Spirochaetaceae bacterium]